MSISKKIFTNRKKIINAWIHIDSIASAKIIAKAGFDSITIDLQHGMFSFEKCRDIIQVIEKYKVFPIVRVPSNDIGIINKVLDAGAYGVICPLINNKTDVFKFILRDDQWLMIRPSGTEPVLRCYAESKDLDGAKAILAACKTTIGVN